jgi:glycosyltransferase involved in cell wall biosynthesis
MDANDRGPVHLVNPLWDACGGSEWRSIETWRLLRRHCEARLWSEYEPSPQLSGWVPFTRISPLQLRFPRGGTLVFVGVYFRIGHWIRFAAPARVVVIYNTDQPDRLRKNLTRIASSGRTAEVLYTSPALRRKERGHGPVLESLVDASRFPFRIRSRVRPFTVGRLSRDTPTKHHAEDPALWRALAAEGVRVRIMGGTCLASELGGVPNIELLPAGAEDPETFLHSLDCFVYRTAETWLEAFGRVVIEAMATGLPVVCGDRGGYVDFLAHGRDSLHFTSTAEAIESVRVIRDNVSLARSLGANASRAAVAMQRNATDRTLQFLLGRVSAARGAAHPAVAPGTEVGAGAAE